MRRILPVIALFLALGSLFVAAAWARSGDGGQVQAPAKLAAARAADPFTVPHALPTRDAQQNGFVYGYRSSARLSAEIEAAAAPQRARQTRAARAHAAAAGGATVLVTATVLPGVVVTLDEAGRVSELATNTEQRDLRDVLVVTPRALDAATWADIRAALLEARAGTGTIWIA